VNIAEVMGIAVRAKSATHLQKFVKLNKFIAIPMMIVNITRHVVWRPMYVKMQLTAIPMMIVITISFVI